MQKAGVLYQILDDEKYAKFVKDMLFEYAKHISNITNTSQNHVHMQEVNYFGNV